MADWATDIEEFRAARTRLGLTQAALAGRMGVHPVTVARWESGARKVPRLALRFIALIS
jgi:DNA-binding transcriptional regulator YiaG